jgi:uncharacterized protein YjaZ
VLYVPSDRCLRGFCFYKSGAEASGIPPYSGYAVGYHAVQGFLKKTGISIEQATVLEGVASKKINKINTYYKNIAKA